MTAEGSHLRRAESPDAAPVGLDRRLLDLIGDATGLVGLAEFRHELMRAVRRAVPADWVSLNDVAPDPAQTVVLIEPSMADAHVEMFARLAHQNPLVDHIARTRDGRPRRFSDLVTPSELHALEIYDRFYKQVDVEHQLAFTLPHASDRILGLALSRSAASGDFLDDEKALLETARPFLIQAYHNAIRYTEALDGSEQGRFSGEPDEAALISLGLTPRQAQVLCLVALGSGDDHIAGRLGISRRTVEKHLEACYRRLEVHDRAQAVTLAWSARGRGRD